MAQVVRQTLFLCLLFTELSIGTEVKWTAAKNDNNDAAATAPKSQKYWDENNIERPDYAKTDAEVLMEQGGGSIAKVLVILAIVATIGYFVVWPRILHGPGNRLGSSSGYGLGLSISGRSEEAARQARLSRFEQKMD